MKSTYIIFFILFLDLIAFTIILPLFPSIIESYNEQNSSQEQSDYALDYIHKIMEWIRNKLNMPDRRRYNNVLVGGLLGSLFSLLQFVSSPIIGAFSDVYGRKKILILSMIGTSISYIIWWKADTFSIFLLSRVVGGLSKGSVTLCTTMISDVTTNENRGKGMAFIGLAFSFGFISGPMIGAYFASQVQSTGLANSFTLPAQVAIVFQMLSLLLAVSLLDETKITKKETTISSNLSKALNLINPFNIFTLSSIKNDKKVAVLKSLTLTNFLYLLFFSGLEFTLTFLTHERFNFTSMQQGKLFFFAGLIMMIVQGGYVRRVKQNREKKIAMQGIVTIVPAMMLISVTYSVQITYAALLLYSFGAGTVVPCLTSLFTQHTDDSDTGESVGILRSAGAFARAIAPALTCSVYWSLGSFVCYFTGALLFVIPLVLLRNTIISDAETKKK